MNDNIVKVDNLMKNQQIKFSVACKAYKLIRRGMSVETALVIANAREGRYLGKKSVKNKNTKTLEQLIMEMEKKANVLFCALYEDEPLPDMNVIISDAMMSIDYEASRKLNAPRIGKDALDYCYSNTDGAEVLF